MNVTGSLETGARLGPYTILKRIGAGGMGEVYKAHDPTLARDVAVKIVRGDFARESDRLDRLQREARILASLNHPHIAAIYGLDSSAGTPVLVMELVDGVTLADRLMAGPVPVEESLRIAGEIAEALEYAHERSVVHRDLKPANVKVAADGAVKVLDFGLAKALSTRIAEDGQPALSTYSHLSTQAGVIFGTPAYMSPEQASGRPVDRRSDIWAFGCVLYELLTGTRPFVGETTTETLAAVLRGEPDWSRLPRDTPGEIAALVQRCLRKDPRHRLQAIGDARIAIEEVLEGGAAPGSASASRHSSYPLALIVLATAAAAALAGFAAWSLKPVPVVPAPVRAFTIALPSGQELASLDRGTLALSPDGDQLAYVARSVPNGAQQIYVRAMETGDTRALGGTEGATMPFFSPDGEWLGFFADGKLKKVPLDGGVTVSLAAVTNPLGATWAAPHTILYASLWSVLQQVPDSGGAPQPATSFQGAENSHVWPVAVADRNALLFTASGPASRGIVMQVAGQNSHQGLLSSEGAAFPGYAPPGYLTFQQANNLMAVPVDLPRGRALGNAVLAVPHVLQYAVSGSGTLAYAVGNPPETKSVLTWVNREGIAETIDNRPDDYYQPRLDPNRDDRVVVDLKGQVWMFDLATHNLAPFTFGERNQHAIWTRDGQRLVFMTQTGRTWQLSMQSTDGSGRPERLGGDVGMMDIPYSLTPDGTLAFVKYSPTAEGELWVLPMHAAKPAAARRLFSIPPADADAGPMFSPDGRWVAYAASDASGRRQVYVQAYPGPGGKHQVSIDGGNEPTWNPARGPHALELIYRNGDDMMAVTITTDPVFSQQKPRRLFSGTSRYQPVKFNYVRPNYDVSHDGNRFLMLQSVGRQEAPVTEIHVVLNWSEALKRLAPLVK